jgi:hypothetical protein
MNDRRENNFHQYLPTYDWRAFRTTFGQIGTLFTILLYKELIITFTTLFFPSWTGVKLNTSVTERVHDCCIALLQGLSTLTLLIAQRALYFPIAGICASFTILTILIISTLILVQATLGLLLNLMFLVINNLIIHTLLLGLLTNIAIIAISIIPALVDACSQERLKAGLNGAALSLYSAFLVIKHIVLHLPSLILGWRYLYLNIEQPINQQFLSLKEFDNDEWIFGFKSSVCAALSESLERLVPYLTSLVRYILYMVSAPVFIFANIIQALLLCACVAEKSLLTLPIKLISFCSSSLINSKSKDSSAQIATIYEQVNDFARAAHAA